MCGISAIYRYTQITDADKVKLAMMNKEMYYRGPDENDVWSDNRCGLAQTRLSIIGLENGKQPLFNESNSLMLICNGEIYNYIELRQELIAKGHIFNSGTDSETIVHLYEEYGVKCVEHLRGMFAFCLWDTNKEQLFVARDRIGEKPLYYLQLPDGVVFSSELRALEKHFLVRPQLNIQSLCETIRFNFPIDLKATYLDQINRVQAGEYILVSQDGIRKFSYWSRNLKSKFKGTFQEAKEKTLDLIKESVEISLRSDVPVAVLLSSGIDSSLIAYMAKQTRSEVHAITAGYKGQHDCDERLIAKKFAQEIGLIHHEVELDVNNFKNIFYEYTQYIDEPVSDIASIPQWALYKKAKEMVFTVLLGGLGGDELFYGYPYFNNLAQSIYLTKKHRSFFPWNTRSKKIEFLKFLLKNWRHILFAGYPNKLDDSAPFYWNYNDYKEFINTARITINNKVYCFSDFIIKYGLSDDYEIKDVYEFVFTRFMTSQCLYLADRLGMGNSLEIRSPLVDYKLVEFVTSIPQQFKFVNGKPKYFLREILKDILPDYIIKGNKMGFTPPVGFIENIVNEYNYKSIKADYKFFNAILADKLISKIDYH